MYIFGLSLYKIFCPVCKHDLLPPHNSCHHFIVLESDLICLCLSPLACWKLMTQRSQRVRQTLHFHHTKILYCFTDNFIPELMQALSITQFERNAELTADIRSQFWLLAFCFSATEVERKKTDLRMYLPLFCYLSK